MHSSNKNLRALQKILAWPTKKPNVSEFHHGFFNNSNKKLFNSILSSNTKLVLELGSWLGSSARYILDTAPNAKIICVDTWSEYGFGTFNKTWHPEYLKNKMHLIYEIFLVNCWNYKQRLIPLRTTTLKAIPLLAKLNIVPDIIYVDANHEFEEVSADLEASFKYFPTTTLVGDDWLWPKDSINNPVKEAVNKFCKKTGRKVKVIDSWSWIIK